MSTWWPPSRRRHRERAEAQAHRALEKWQCRCEPRPRLHALALGFTDRDSMAVLLEPDDAHRAYDQLVNRIGFWSWRSEFIVDPVFELTAVDGARVAVAVPHLAAVLLMSGDDPAALARQLATKRQWQQWQGQEASR